jgi:glycerol-3-phosphate cytidylyltransferase
MIGFVCGAYDLFHAGHNILLRDCKDQCDKLIVGLHTNPNIDRKEKNKPIQSVFERWVQLKNCSWVDEIIPYETESDLINLFATTKIDRRFLGEDYIGKLFTGESLCKQLNIEIVFIKRRHNFSSTELRNRVYDVEAKSRISRS